MMKKISKREISIVLFVSVAYLAACIVLFAKIAAPEWKYYQSEFRAIVTESVANVDNSSIPQGVQQIWLKDLGRVDRCTTCHQGIGWKDLDNVEQPWKSHPDPELMKHHPVDQYGCTSCHGGQGLAVTQADAHGFVKHWEEPILSNIIGADYDPRTPPSLFEINCNQCHRHERSTKGMDMINHAKALVRDKRCKVCHIINGEGGRMGPNLTNVGSKSAEEFDFANFTGLQLSILSWHIAHFKSPPTIIPNSIMPEMNFQTRDSIALAMLAMSWKDNSVIPRQYIPGIDLREFQTPEEIERDRIMREGGGAFFVEHNCFVCHSVKAYKLKSPTDKGPDLSLAPDDVRARFSKSLEEFVFDPTGTMKIIFESQILLTKEEKWEAIEKIMKAYDIVKNRSEEKQK